MGRVRMVSGSDGEGLTTKPGLQMRRVGAEVVRSPVTGEAVGAHEHGLDRAHEGLGLHDVLPMSGTKDDVGFHGGGSGLDVAKVIGIHTDSAQEC